MNFLRRGLVLLVVPSSACASLLGVDFDGTPADAAYIDATAAEPDAPRPEEEAARDAGQAYEPSPDFACSDFWSEPVKKDLRCSARQVVVVDGESHVVTGISIARTAAGRVGVVYGFEEGADSGGMRFIHFVPRGPGATPTVLDRALSFGEFAGFSLRIVASYQDDFFILSHDVDMESRSGDVVLLRQRSGQPRFDMPELIIGQVGAPSTIALTADDSGTVFATARLLVGTDDDGGGLGRVVVRKKAVGAAVQALPDLASGLLVSGAPDVGGAALSVDAAGQLHALYHDRTAVGFSSPRYRTWTGVSFSYPKPLVFSSGVSVTSGAEPRLFVHRTDKIAVFLARKRTDPAAQATASLRVARWQLQNDSPAFESAAEGIPSPDPEQVRHHFAAAIDRFGLIHTALVLPKQNSSLGSLQYIRQGSDGFGKVTWLLDTVDPAVMYENGDAFVDLTVDEKGRPHIAYASGKDGKIRYATRYDRD